MFGRVLHRSQDAMYLLVFFVSIAVVIFGLIHFAGVGTYDEASKTCPDWTRYGGVTFSFRTVCFSVGWW